MNTRYLWIAAAVVAVLAIVIVVGLWSPEQPTSVASPTASASASVPRPSTTASSPPSPSSTNVGSIGPTGGTGVNALYNDDFGFVVSGGDGPPHATIRKESANAGTGTTQLAPQALAVSPDGKQIAYWTLFSTPPELRILNASTGSEQTLVTMAADQRGGGVVWSSDGAGLLYSTEKGSFGIGGGTNSATLDVYEFAASGKRGTVDAQTNTGWLYRPIAWDRAANVAAAGLTGEGAGLSFYVTVQMDRISSSASPIVTRVDTRSRTTLGMPIGSIRASSDAKFVLGVDIDSGDIKWWPLADIAASKSQAGAGKRGALWRPGTHEIGFMSAEQLWLGDVDKAGALGLCCTAFSGASATSTIRMFRADGTAVLLGVPAGNPYLANYTLVRLGTDPKSTSGDRVTFQDLGGIFASVRFR
jgi:hypothetical protein